MQQTEGFKRATGASTKKEKMLLQMISSPLRHTIPTTRRGFLLK